MRHRAGQAGYRGQRRQSGVSLLTAVFLITALAVLGSLMTKLMVLSSVETIQEWQSAQALYAAETGIDWAARYIEEQLYDPNFDGSHLDTQCDPSTAPYTSPEQTLIAGRAWFSVSIYCQGNGAQLYLYHITSTGKAGGTAANPQAQRRLEMLFSPL